LYKIVGANGIGLCCIQAYTGSTCQQVQISKEEMRIICSWDCTDGVINDMSLASDEDPFYSPWVWLLNC